MFKKIAPYLLNILWLFSLLLLIAWLVGIEPFGAHTVLTIDLKQQYLEFFGYFRHTLLVQPDGFMYSFAKGIGGNMLGLWAYYLLSPFNFLFLCVPIIWLPQMITIVIVLKLLAMSSGFFYFVRRQYQLDTTMAILFSSCYTLSAYVVTYYSNVMWLDTLILLPIVAVGLHQLLHRQKWHLYTGALACSIMTNYYIGYMVCLFLAVYAVFAWGEQHEQWDWRKFRCDYLRFVGYSLLAVALSSIVLVPTFAALLTSKANYAQSAWNLDTAFSLGDVFAKSFIGSFKLEEIRYGSPQIYVGLFGVVLNVYYFITTSIRRHEKLIAGAILGIFYLAFHFKFINRIWHGGQFPIWYPFRFSFLWCFFALILAIKVWHKRTTFQWHRHGIATLVSLIALSYYWFHVTDYSFLTHNKIVLSISLMVLYSVAVLFWRWKEWLLNLFLLLIISGELVTNAFIVLPKFELANAQETYQQLTAIQAEIAQLPEQRLFNRTYKTFNRSRNDALLFAYNGLSHFSSTTQTNTTQLFAALGLAQTSTSAHYTGGTLFTDDLLAIEHLLALRYPKEVPLYATATDLDMLIYPADYQSQHFIRRYNADHFGLGVATGAQLTEMAFVENQPILNQERLLQTIADDSGPYFEEVTLTPTSLTNLTFKKERYHKLTKNKEASLTYQFETTSGQPYYIVLPKALGNKQIKLYLNGKRLVFYPNFLANQVIAISHGQTGTQQLEISIPKGQMLPFDDLKLYAFNQTDYEQLTFNRFDMTSFSHTRIEGQIDIASNQAYVLFSIPYDKNWHVQINQQPVQTQAVLNGTLLAVPVKAGKQQITLSYRDNSLLIGGICSLTTLAICLLITRRQHT
ncbi:YfhO family protein [Aerococcaceae bacterium NML171108]|nr:YfhO family protein [Aerococcaceae bacterium NML171108]